MPILAPKMLLPSAQVDCTKIGDVEIQCGQGIIAVKKAMRGTSLQNNSTIQVYILKLCTLESRIVLLFTYVWTINNHILCTHSLNSSFSIDRKWKHISWYPTRFVVHLQWFSLCQRLSRTLFLISGYVRTDASFSRCQSGLPVKTKTLHDKVKKYVLTQCHGKS